MGFGRLSAALLFGLLWCSTASADPIHRFVAEVPAKATCLGSHLMLDYDGGTGAISGIVVNDTGSYAVTGLIETRGRGTIRIGDVAGTVRFTGSRFVADYPNLICGLRHAVGVRVD